MWQTDSKCKGPRKNKTVLKYNKVGVRELSDFKFYSKV
jgi:hypothetical protein